MIDHVSVAVRDLAKAMAFYDALLAPLDMTRLETRPATCGYGKTYSEFWINHRAGMTPLAADSGQHVCLRARSAEAVDAFHAVALAKGESSDGAPGLRPAHGEGYYSAFVCDPDGNRIETVTFLSAAN